MPVHQPGRVLLHHVPLKFVRDKVSGGAKKNVDVAITLVPFIDFLIVLVVFLLMSFAASGELMAQQESIVLPTAEIVTDLEVAPVIAITAPHGPASGVVMLEGIRMADTASLMENARVDRIESLVENLERLRRDWGTLHPGQQFAGTVIFQADQGIDFRVIKKVMASCVQAGYTNISFAVNRQGGGD